MLWLKAWLEIRWRLIFITLFLAFPLFLNTVVSPAPKDRQFQGFIRVFPVFWAVAGVMLAGSGVKTQSARFQSARGGHRSVQFTLSLPVSRLRLLATRTAVGLLSVFVAVAISTGLVWLTFRDVVSWPDLVPYLLVVFICQCAFYGFGTILSTLVDEMYQGWIGIISIQAAGLLSNRATFPAVIDIFRAMGAESPIVTHVVPWSALLGAIMISATLMIAALKIIQSQEY